MIIGDLHIAQVTFNAAPLNFKSDLALPFASFFAWFLACAKFFWLPRTIVHGTSVKECTRAAARAEKGSTRRRASGECRCDSKNAKSAKIKIEIRVHETETKSESSYALKGFALKSSLSVLTLRQSQPAGPPRSTRPPRLRQCVSPARPPGRSPWFPSSSRTEPLTARRL